MTQSLHQPLRKYNPGTLQSDEEVIRQFVVRHRELDALLEVLRANVASPTCQHMLLVAPRGRGKTMLLARVAAELRTKKDLTTSLLPVQFMEESHEIFTLTDFWLDALFYLARELTTSNPQLSQELLKSRAHFVRSWRVEDAGRVRATALDAADRLGRQLVLMVENLQELCKNVDDDFGWQLRATLQSDPQVILLATATSRFSGLDDATQPFFELFRTIFLEPLDTADCQRLWKLAAGDDQRNVRPLQILTGGSPRLLVMLADFAKHRSLRQLMEELVSLIDDHTEYFRSHLEALPKVECRVYVAALDLWQPSSTGEIAERARMDVRTVSALLGRLVDRGALIIDGTDRKRRYVAAERLYNIYYKLRRERDEASVVQHLIHFMATFYENVEQQEGFWNRLIRDAKQSPTIREGMRRAIDDDAWVSHGEFAKVYVDASKMPDEALRAALKEGSFDEAIENADLFGAYTAPRSTATRLLELVNKVDFVVDTCEDMVDRLGNDPAPEVQAQVARAIVRKGIMQRHAGRPEAAVITCNEVLARFGKSINRDLEEAVAKALITKGLAHEQLRDTYGAIAICEEILERFGAGVSLELERAVAKALLRKMTMQTGLENWEAAEAAFEELLRRFGSRRAPEFRLACALALVAKGDAQEKLEDADGAVATYEKVIEQCDDEGRPELQAVVVKAMVHKATLCATVLEDVESAMAMCSSVIGRFGAEAAPVVQAGVAYALVIRAGCQLLVGRAEEALSVCKEIELRCGGCGLDPDIPGAACECSVMVETAALIVQGRLGDARESVRALYVAFESKDVGGTRVFIDFVRSMIAIGMPERDLVEILSSDEEKAQALAPLIIALRQGAGETVRAPTEVLEIAGDVRARIGTAVRGAAERVGQ